jgi:hypothetical protein
MTGAAVRFGIKRKDNEKIWFWIVRGRMGVLWEISTGEFDVARRRCKGESKGMGAIFNFLDNAISIKAIEEHPVSNNTSKEEGKMPLKRKNPSWTKRPCDPSSPKTIEDNNKGEVTEGTT